MKIQVYDTYARRTDGVVMHFDVFTAGKDDAKAYEYALEWLAEIGADAELSQNHCRFCHSQQSPSPEVDTAITQKGYYIYKMENCP